MRKKLQYLRILLILPAVYICLTAEGQEAGPLPYDFNAITIKESGSAEPWDPVNSNASDSVRKVLEFLYAIKGKGIITGQENLATDVLAWTNEVKDITGRFPGLLGEDFSYGDSALLKRERIVETAIDYWNAGGLVTISWHQVNPLTWDGSVNEGPFEYTQYKMTQETFNQLFVPESDLQVKYLEHIDLVAGYLKQLEEAGVVVLWRPYHEMNGGWFWWGDKSNFRDMWRGMYSRFTFYHGLNNLIWVWSPNISQGDMTSFYPGDEYVDIVGLDGYADITNWDIRTSLSDDIDDIISLSKGDMVSFTELGWLPDPDWLQADRPQFTWFLNWWTHITKYNSDRWINNVYHHDYAMNRGDFLWKEFPVVLTKEFEDLTFINSGEPIRVLDNIPLYYYYPDGKNLQLEVTVKENHHNLEVEISDSIILHPAPADTGTIVFQVVASTSMDSITRQFSVTLHQALSVHSGIPHREKISVFPNPAAHLLNVSTMTGIEHIFINDLSGRRVCHIDNHLKSEQLIHIGYLNPGYYTIFFESAEETTIKQFIKL